VILVLRDVGFSLHESKALLASRTQAVEGWHSLAHRKLADLDEQIAKAQTAKEAITAPTLWQRCASYQSAPIGVGTEGCAGWSPNGGHWILRPVDSSFSR